jgi:hypothetical protein
MNVKTRKRKPLGVHGLVILRTEGPKLISLVLQYHVWLLGLAKYPARGYTCHEILLQGAVMAYS